MLIERDLGRARQRERLATADRRRLASEAAGVLAQSQTSPPGTGLRGRLGYGLVNTVIRILDGGRTAA